MDKVLFYCPCHSLSKILSNNIGFINIGSLVKNLLSKYFVCLHLSVLSCLYYTLYQHINFIFYTRCL